MEKYIALAKKLYALATKGVGGEKQNAQSMLDALLKKHNISIEDIEEETIRERHFKLTKETKPLFVQIVACTRYGIKQYGIFPAKDVKYFNLPGNFMIECTDSEFIEIEAKFDFYHKLLIEEQDVFFTAFLAANDLLANNPNKVEEINTPEEIEKYKRVAALSSKIKKGQFMKQLN